MDYGLPTSVKVNGTDYKIRSDYREILDICNALSDGELSDQDKTITALLIFYPDIDNMPTSDYQEAVKRCFWFINCGDEEQQDRNSAKLVDWEKDFKYIVAPINRICGQEVRTANYMHWWTFISAYYEIGSDCLFAQIVGIREKLANHKPLDKADREWYQKNRNLVDIKTSYTNEETELLKQFGLK